MSKLSWRRRRTEGRTELASMSQEFKILHQKVDAKCCMAQIKLVKGQVILVVQHYVALQVAALICVCYHLCIHPIFM